MYERAGELDSLRGQVAAQKETFGNRYEVLDTNIKHIHQISSMIQKSLSVQEVLSLCSKALHDIFGEYLTGQHPDHT